MGVKSIGEGLKKRLRTINDLRVYAPHELPKSIRDFPVALIMPPATSYHDTHGGADYMTLTYRILLALTNQDQPDKLSKLIDYIEPTGDKSIVAAIEGDGTLGGEASDSWVLNNSGAGYVNWGGINYLGTEFESKVLS